MGGGRGSQQPPGHQLVFPLGPTADATMLPLSTTWCTAREAASHPFLGMAMFASHFSWEEGRWVLGTAAAAVAANHDNQWDWAPSNANAPGEGAVMVAS